MPKKIQEEDFRAPLGTITPKAQLDDKGRCCGRKPIDYKGSSWRSPARPQKFCDRCCRSYNRETGEQIENWAWRERSDGSFQRVR